MTSPTNSNAIPPQTLRLQYLDNSYTLTIKQRRFDTIFDQVTIRPSRNEMNALKIRYPASSKDCIVKKMKSKLKHRALKLKNLETKINAITGGSPSIRIENHVDFDIPFINFRYVNNCVVSSDINLSSEYPTGCDCGRDGRNSCFNSRSKCCPAEFSSPFAYNKKGKIILPQGVAVYECCCECNCGPNCGNRVVQHGNHGHRFCVFKTTNGRGWGVKTLKSIPKGMFVEVVVGEIIPSQEAARREKIQLGSLQQTYLFDLDFIGPQNNQYSIDCFAHGNITRYLNHSCMPNLGVYNVWIDHRDKHLPKLALFALKDIKQDEELTLDYNPQIGYQRKKVSQTDRANQIPCLCGTAKCRKFLWSN